MQVLTREEWEPRARAHAARVGVYTAPHLERRRRGEAHPVHDFLFGYYSHSPAALARWHPGWGVALADAPEYEGVKGYAPVEVASHGLPGSTGVSTGKAWRTTSDLLASRRPLIEQVRRLLVATAGRPATLSCFGLHEWAMVHRADETRHPVPLRLGAAGTDEVVESHRISCSHFDAFRFFTPTARGLNLLSPGRDDRPAYEQPGCLHAGMDLYKHAFRLSPLIPSDLVADAFELAWEIRVLDMRAAPYEMTGVRLDPGGEDWTPVRIETPEGKAEYVAAQREFAERGAPIRARLVEACDGLLAV